MRNPFARKTPQQQTAPITQEPVSTLDDSAASRIVSSLTGYALRHPQQAEMVYGRISPSAATYDAAVSTLSQVLREDPPAAQRILEQINPTAISSSPVQEDWYWGRLATGDEEDYYWRRLSDNWYQKDVIPSTFLEILNTCYEAYNANPLAMAIVEITTSFVIGKGVKVVARQKKVQRVLNEFWHDVDNRMDERVEDMCRELSLYGEIYVRFFVNPYDGTVKVRLIDPALIDQIDTDPEDIEHHLRYHMRPLGPSPTQTYDVVANTLDPGVFRGGTVANSDSQGVGNGTIGAMVVGNKALSGQNPGDPTITGKWLEAGKDAIQIAINKVSNAKRGKSDLATLLPWLRRYKDWLTDRVRINKYKGAFLWDVTLTGADKKTIAAKAGEYAYPPEPGSSIVHNETETWKAVQPSIAADDASSDGRAIKLMVALGATIPEHFLSDGNNNNRATATEMGLPTFLKFQRRQKILRFALTRVLNRVLEEAMRAGKLAQSTQLSGAYDILFPEFDQSSNQELGMALSYLLQGLTSAKEQGWISDDSAMRMIFQFLDQEVDPHEEREKIMAESLAAQQKKPAPGFQAPAKKPALPVPVKKKSGQGRLGAPATLPAKVQEVVAPPLPPPESINTGMMFALYPSPGVASELAINGEEPAEELHVTLVYLGDMQDQDAKPDVFKLAGIGKFIAGAFPPLVGKIGGLGRFKSDGDSGDADPVYASVDVPGLAELRTMLARTLKARDIFVAEDHGFTPHITLAYVPGDAPTPAGIELPDNIPCAFETLSLVIGEQRYDFPLTGAEQEE